MGRIPMTEQHDQQTPQDDLQEDRMGVPTGNILPFDCTQPYAALTDPVSDLCNEIVTVG
jgi:hypothetical protein